jgi:hypothetical protein
MNIECSARLDRARKAQKKEQGIKVNHAAQKKCPVESTTGHFLAIKA